jgi:WD40 repeat protein
MCVLTCACVVVVPGSILPAVQCVKLFPDGKHGVSGGRDAMGYYWDFSRGAKLATFAGHSGSVLCCHVHQRKVVTGSMDGLIKASAGGCRLSLLLTKRPFSALPTWLLLPLIDGLSTRFSPSNQVWDLRTGSVSMTLSGHASPVWCLKVSEADDFTVVSGGDDGNVKVWDLRSVFGGSRLTMAGHTDSVTTLAWDWTKVVTGSRDCTVRVWDLNVGRQLTVCSGHTANVSSVALLDTQVVSASWDGRVRCWFA